MADDVFTLFDEYAASFARGERPDARSYLARAGERAGELATLIDRYLESVPAPAPDEDARAAAAAWLEGEPPLLALRTRRGLRRDDVVDALMSALRLDPKKREKVKGYYHRLEGGLLEPGRVNRRVFEVLAETMRASLVDVSRWRPRPIEAAPAYRVDALAPASAPRPRLAGREAPEEDEIDQLFVGGADET